MGRVRVTIVAVEKHYYILWAGVCSFSYPACCAHAPCFIAICGLPGRLCHILPHVSQTARFATKQKITAHKMYVLVLSTASPETCLILRRLQLYIISRLSQFREAPANQHGDTEDACIAIHFATHAYQTCRRTSTARKGERVHSLLLDAPGWPWCSLATAHQSDGTGCNWSVLWHTNSYSTTVFVINKKLHQMNR